MLQELLLEDLSQDGREKDVDDLRLHALLFSQKALSQSLPFGCCCHWLRGRRRAGSAKEAQCQQWAAGELTWLALPHPD